MLKHSLRSSPAFSAAPSNSRYNSGLALGKVSFRNQVNGVASGTALFLPSPPVLRGRGDEGLLGSRAMPLTPVPSPPEYRGRGEENFGDYTGREADYIIS